MALVAAIALFFGGIWLLWRGQWPRRVGLTPHCRGCNYILTGLAADRCPECGRPLGPANTVHGERRRRPGISAGGIFLLVIAMALCIAPFTTSWQQIQWYHYRPTAWVMADLDSSSTAVKTKAWTELQRRLGNGALSAAQQDRLVERALREQQTGGGAAGYMPTMIDFLGQRYLDHKLSSEQADAFFANALNLKLEVRPLVGRDDPVPFRISAAGRGPQTGWWMRESQLGCWIDDRKLNQGTMSSTGGFSGRSSMSSVQPQSPGKHRLRVEVEIGAGTGNFPSFNTPLDHPRTLELTADFEVSVDKVPFQWVTSPDAVNIASHLTASDFRINPGFMPLTGQINAADPPVNLAFDVFAYVNGKEYALGSVTFYQSPTTSGSHAASYQVSARSLPPGDHRQINIILRSSEQAAKQTVDFTTAWQGEITIANVPVRQPPVTQPIIPTTQE